MKKRYSYAECYRILEIDPSCSWDELRRAYRLQIQKWHPDKFADSSPQKTAADDKIKCITTANQQLAVYYRQHGKLPEPETAAAARKLPQPEATRSRPANTYKSTVTSATKKPPSRSSVMPFMAVMIIILIVFMYFAPEDDFAPLQLAAKASHLSVPATSATVHDKSPAAESTVPAEPVATVPEEFITYGSTIGEVISIQGAPTRDEGDIWYYAESELYFENGKVIGWRHAPDSKLKTGIAVQKSN